MSNNAKFLISLESLDGKPITERTGSSLVKGQVNRPKPILQSGLIVTYPEQYKAKHNKSPGIFLWVTSLDSQEQGTFVIKDYEGRAFRIIYLDEQ